MSNVGYATLTVIPSAKGFGKALSGDVNPAMRSAGSAGGGVLGGALGGAAASVLGPAMAALGAVAIGGFVKSAIASAGDLEQSVGAIDAVFKGNAAQMHEWSKSAAMDVGLTRNEFNELGTLIGAQLKNGGTAMDQLAPKTQTLIGLGADLSSMFGGTTREAVEAISSALKGEMDPIEKYGISLNDAALRAEAMALGLDTSGASLSNATKQAAAMSLMMKQSSDAQGNFAREADTLAGKQQRINALWQDGKTRLGGAFLPAVSAAAGALLSVMGPALDSAVVGVEWLVKAATGLYDILGRGDFTSAFREAFNVQEDSPIVDFLFRIRESVEGIAAVFGPVLGQLASAFGPVIGQVIGLFAAFSPLSLILQALQPVLPTIASLLGQLGNTLAVGLGSALTMLTPLLEMLASTFASAFAAVLPTILQLVTTLASVFGYLIPPIQAVLAAVIPLVTTLVSQLAPIFVQLVNAVLPPVIAIIQAIVPAILPLVQIIIARLIPVIEALMPVVTTVFGIIADVIGAAMTIIQGIIQAVSALITGDWEGFWAGIGTILSGVWDLLVSIVTGAINLVSSIIGAALEIIGSVWTGFWGMIADFFGGIWDGILGIMSGAGDWLSGVGEDLIQGFLDGINNAWKWVESTIRDLFGGAIDLVKGILGIHSPSRVFMEIGGYTGEGMAIGLRKSGSLIEDASEALIPTIPKVHSSSALEVEARQADAATSAGSAPLIGSLTLESRGEIRDDLEEALFHLRRINRGGLHNA